jgi:hypothetical protein
VIKQLVKAQYLAQRLYAWRVVLVMLGLYALGFALYYLQQRQSASTEMALLLSVVLFGWVLLAWLVLLLFRELPDWQTPDSLWQKIKQASHKFWYQLLLCACLLLSIATLYLTAKALKALLSQLL